MNKRELNRAKHLWLKTSEVARYLAVSLDHVRALIRSGLLEAVDVGAGRRPTYRVSRNALGDYLEGTK